MSETPAGRDPRGRIDRLAAMGVVSWLPRRELPGAPPGPAWVRVVPAAAAPRGPAPGSRMRPLAGRAVTEPATRTPGTGAARSEAPPVTMTRPPAAAVPSAPLPEAGAGEGPLLRLELQEVAGRCAILFWWPERPPEPAERAFAADLVYAAGAVPEALREPRVFDARRKQALGGAGALQAAVSGFLAGLQDVALVSIGDGRAGEIRLGDCLRPGVELLELPSVREMIAHPARKSDAWKRLAAFLSTG